MHFTREVSAGSPYEVGLPCVISFHKQTDTRAGICICTDWLSGRLVGSGPASCERVSKMHPALIGHPENDPKSVNEAMSVCVYAACRTEDGVCFGFPDRSATGKSSGRRWDLPCTSTQGCVLTWRWSGGWVWLSIRVIKAKVGDFLCVALGEETPICKGSKRSVVMGKLDPPLVDFMHRFGCSAR